MDVIICDYLDNIATCCKTADILPAVAGKGFRI